ncbi:MAG: hypothetical protein Faunusvirus3_3 [Faunusvirus sp.]|jgi:hypothetical protein|uniref:Uncharacterized protein n=1 Tax=Faunusvirus sp. TaxID=2487766 RepID=A0A3G4ZZX1_9VIRU|nr:MAG: hypothetical protein Faunusvirus3_3 [Faunusvirus sp.]
MSFINFAANNSYIDDHNTVQCESRYECMIKLEEDDVEEACENIEYEINVESLVTRKIYDLPTKQRRKHVLENDIISKKPQYCNSDNARKLHYISLDSLIEGVDMLYDMVLTGDIYRVIFLLDNNIVMTVINQFNDNNVVEIPVFTASNPFPFISLSYGKISLAIEMNQDYDPQVGEKIKLSFTAGYYKNMSRKMLMLAKFKIDLNENEDALIFFDGKCILLSEGIPTYVISR